MTTKDSGNEAPGEYEHHMKRSYTEVLPLNFRCWLDRLNKDEAKEFLDWFDTTPDAEMFNAIASFFAVRYGDEI